MKSFKLFLATTMLLCFNSCGNEQNNSKMNEEIRDLERSYQEVSFEFQKLEEKYKKITGDSRSYYNGKESKNLSCKEQSKYIDNRSNINAYLKRGGIEISPIETKKEISVECDENNTRLNLLKEFIFNKSIEFTKKIRELNEETAIQKRKNKKISQSLEKIRMDMTYMKRRISLRDFNKKKLESLHKNEKEEKNKIVKCLRRYFSSSQKNNSTPNPKKSSLNFPAIRNKIFIDNKTPDNKKTSKECNFNIYNSNKSSEITATTEKLHPKTIASITTNKKIGNFRNKKANKVFFNIKNINI